MGEDKAILKELNKFGRSISGALNIERIIFFGSRARGNHHRDSDIDLLIISKDFEQVKSFKRSVKLYDYWKLDYPVDFICLTPQEFNRRKLQVGTIKQAVEEGIEIKAS